MLIPINMPAGTGGQRVPNLIFHSNEELTFNMREIYIRTY
jgi:hypothetical protein